MQTGKIARLWAEYYREKEIMETLIDRVDMITTDIKRKKDRMANIKRTIDEIKGNK
jgi:hypothetical protein